MNALRLYYLAIYVGLGAVLPLLALAMQARGLRPTQYAWLIALLPLSRMLAPPLWGMLADKWVGTSKLLRANTLGLNYYGFVEGTDLCKGTVDVVVTDGFTGNVALKTAEGTARFVKDLLKGALKSGPLALIGAILAGPALKKMARRIDPPAQPPGA